MKVALKKIAPYLSLFCVGIISYLLYNRYLIINFPFKIRHVEAGLAHMKKKSTSVTLYFWHNNRWQTEKSTVLWSDDTADVMRQLIKQLLDILEQEQIIEKQISIEQLVLTAHKTQAIVSFDRNILNKKSSTFEKLMIIESLLKTIRENNITVKELIFLTHYKPMHDAELDFSHPWPILGFINS